MNPLPPTWSGMKTFAIATIAEIAASTLTKTRRRRRASDARRTTQIVAICTATTIEMARPPMRVTESTYVSRMSSNTNP